MAVLVRATDELRGLVGFGRVRGEAMLTKIDGLIRWRDRRWRRYGRLGGWVKDGVHREDAALRIGRRGMDMIVGKREASWSLLSSSST